ncbi:MAG: hypothetical protein A3F68_11375 [Acidobacteria bacterium RIFCSPLOWO2_12_FULL_54_10]|nr:MAG: hypothetical protein A3F68_11375 [Acidobacteria bacterium RIFCSPLOWO2_12_FULL_54_10]
MGFYGQDTFSVRPGLSLDLGLRYEFTTLVHDEMNRDVYLPNPMRDSVLQTGRFLESNPSLKNFSPRLGLSWSPFGPRGMVIRAGAGIYYDQLLEYIVDKRKNSAPFYQRAVRTNFNAQPYPLKDAVRAVLEANIPFHVEVLDYKTDSTPVVLRYDFSLQQDLPGGLNASFAYVGARGNHLYRSFEANELPLPDVRADGSLFFPAQCSQLPANASASDRQTCRAYAGPINPAFSTISYTTADAQSFYNSLRISLSKRLGQAASIQGSYTFSKSIDDSSSDSFEAGQYGWDRTENRGLSDFDVRHRIVFNYFYNLPFGAGHSWLNSGIASTILGGWRIGGIVNWRTGVPYSATVSMRSQGYLFAPSRPSLKAGSSNNPTEGTTAGCGPIPAGQQLGTRDRYYDPCAFAPPAAGTVGNLARNSIIAPSVFNMDMSLQKDFSIDSKRQLQFRAEVFNLPNHTNFNMNQGGSTIVFRGSGSINPTSGRLGSTATTARQIQLALRLSF